MRYLGIDFGSKKIGLALSDESGSMAFPYSVILNNDKTVTEIEDLISKEKVDKVVIGDSKNLDGENNKLSKAIESFITNLTLRIPIPIEKHDERYSSKEAERLQGKNSETDASAATIILNSYLTSI